MLKWGRSLCAELTLIVLIVLLLNNCLRLHLRIKELLLLLWILALYKSLILARGSLWRPLEGLSVWRNHSLIARMIRNILILVPKVHLIRLHIRIRLVVLRCITTTIWTLILRRSLLTIRNHLRMLISHGQSKIMVRRDINSTLNSFWRWGHHHHVSYHSSRKLLLMNVSCIYLTA